VFHKKLLVTVAIAVSASVVIVWTLISIFTPTDSPPREIILKDSKLSFSCQSDKAHPSKPNSLKFYPIKLVAQPWYGQHNVYAVFALPLKYEDTHTNSELIIKGYDQPLQIMRANEDIYGSPTPAGHFLVVCFFRTRHALWYSLSGRLADLQQPCNWTLYLFDQ
jgi:hypothetical protein